MEQARLEYDEQKVHVVLAGEVGRLQNELLIVHSTHAPPPEYVPAVIEPIAYNPVFRTTAVQGSLHSTSGSNAPEAILHTADVVAVVVSIASPQAHQQARDWSQRAHQLAKHVVLVGAEAEARARGDAVVTQEDLANLCKEINCSRFYEVSAVSDVDGVGRMFDGLIKTALGFIDDDIVEESNHEGCWSVLKGLAYVYPWLGKFVYAAAPWEQRGHHKPITMLSARTDFIFTGGADGKVCIWHSESGIRLRSLRHTHGSSIVHFDASHDGQYVAVADSSGAIYLWDVYMVNPVYIYQFDSAGTQSTDYQIAFPRHLVIHAETNEDEGEIIRESRSMVFDQTMNSMEDSAEASLPTCDPLYFVVKRPRNSRVYRFPVTSQADRVIPMMSDFHDEKHEAPYVESIKAYFLTKSSIDELDTTISSISFVIATLVNGDAMAFDGQTYQMIQYFSGNSKKLRWVSMDQEDIEKLNVANMDEKEMHELSIREKNGIYERRMLKSRTILDFELVGAGSVNVVRADLDVLNKRKVSRARGNSDERRSSHSASDRGGRRRSSSARKINHDERFLMLARCDGASVTLLSLATGLPLKIIEHKDQGRFALPLLKMRVIYDEDFVHLILSSYESRSNRSNVLVYFSEPWSEIRRYDRLSNVDNVVPSTYAGLTIYKVSERPEIKNVTGAFHEGQVHYVPFEVDFLDVMFLPRSHESDIEEMVYVGGSKDGSLFLKFVSFDEDKKELELKVDEEIRQFRLFSSKQGTLSQLIHRYDIVAASSSLLSNEEFNQVSTYNLIHEKDKLHCRSVYLWESITSWFMLLKDHSEMLSLSFDTDFNWSENYFIARFVRALSLNLPFLFTPRMWVIAFWIAMVGMLIANIGYVLLGIPKYTKQFPRFAKFSSVYIPFMASLALFSLGAITVSIFQCSYFEEAFRHDFLSEINGLEFCFKGLHILYCVIGMLMFVPYFILSTRIRSLDGMSGISQSNWLSFTWKYDERQNYVGEFWLRTPSFVYEVVYVLTRLILLFISNVFSDYKQVRIGSYALAAVGLLILTVLQPAFIRRSANSLNTSLFVFVFLTNVVAFMLANTEDEAARASYHFWYYVLSIPLIIVCFYLLKLQHFKNPPCCKKKEFISAISKEQSLILSSETVSKRRRKRFCPGRMKPLREIHDDGTMISAPTTIEVS